MITVCYLFWYSRQNVFLVSYCKYSATRAFLHAWLVTFLLCALCIQLVVGKDVRYRFCYVWTSLKVIPGATEELLYVTTFFMQIQGLAWICHSMWVAREQQWKCVLSWAMCFQWMEPLVTSQQPSCSLMVMQVRKHLIRWSVWVFSKLQYLESLELLMARSSKCFWEESIQIARSCLHPLLLVWSHSFTSTVRQISVISEIIGSAQLLPLIYWYICVSHSPYPWQARYMFKGVTGS